MAEDATVINLPIKKEASIADRLEAMIAADAEEDADGEE